jgi:hypothetical protein
LTPVYVSTMTYRLASMCSPSKGPGLVTFGVADVSTSAAAIGMGGAADSSVVECGGRGASGAGGGGASQRAREEKKPISSSS